MCVPPVGVIVAHVSLVLSGYMNMTPPKYELTVQDCDEALRADASYVKALNRRANALEALSRNEEALRDFTAATILDKFQNELASQAVERVLKKIATDKAAIILTVSMTSGGTTDRLLIGLRHANLDSPHLRLFQLTLRHSVSVCTFTSIMFTSES
jgi:tetratricopeptide (TPR) repeat protein